MKIVSFDGNYNNNISRDPQQDNLFNLFQKNVINVKNITLKIYVVPREYEMRLDRISEFIYGTADYVEELMVINNIINPYSIKEGQEISYCDINLIGNLYTKDMLINKNEIKRQELLNSQPNIGNKISGDQNLPPTIKPSNLNQITVSKDNTVSIINSFE